MLARCKTCSCNLSKYLSSDHSDTAVNTTRQRKGAKTSSKVETRQHGTPQQPHHPAWMGHHPSGSRKDTPRYIGAFTRGGRVWPALTTSSTRHATTNMHERVRRKKDLAFYRKTHQGRISGTPFSVPIVPLGTEILHLFMWPEDIGKC